MASRRSAAAEIPEATSCTSLIGVTDADTEVKFARVLRSFLFEVEPTDPATLIAVGLIFASVAMLACWGPTHRAAKVDPLEALRYE